MVVVFKASLSIPVAAVLTLECGIESLAPVLAPQPKEAIRAPALGNLDTFQPSFQSVILEGDS
jgi:hypothetical protein